MGLYPTRTTEPANTRNATEWIEREDNYGYVLQRTVTATKWVEVERTNCYCCSCDLDRNSYDIYCRNHGWYGTRPCETHNMPGVYGDDGIMPDSVQQVIQQMERSYDK